MLLHIKKIYKQQINEWIAKKNNIIPSKVHHDPGLLVAIKNVVSITTS